jgi:hypothetical protein
MAEDYVARNGYRFSKIAPGSIYESQVTSLVERNLSAIFPSFMGKQMEPFFKTAAGNVKPDLVLVQRDYSGWAVVEVELDVHGFGSHILPQLSKLTHAVAEEKFIREAHKLINPNENFELFSRSFERRPDVFLVIHGESKEYQDKLEKIGVESIDVDVLVSANQANEYLLVAHDRTTILKDLHVKIERSSNPLTRNCWVISEELPSDLNSIGDGVLVSADGQLSRWAVIKSAKGAILRQPSELSVLESIFVANVHYDSESGTLHLIP